LLRSAAVRLFVAVVPPETVLDALVEVIDELRPTANLRWSGRPQLHVTLRFLGDVDDAVVAEAAAALDTTPLAAITATVGPAVTRLGRQVLCAPVAGLDALAAGVTTATAAFGRPPEHRPFVGHITLARAGRRGVVDRSAAGAALSLSWDVDDVRLVRSHLGPAGARYEDLHVRRLGPHV
jgi:2'-5' RNA ligase